MYIKFTVHKSLVKCTLMIGVTVRDENDICQLKATVVFKQAPIPSCLQNLVRS